MRIENRFAVVPSATGWQGANAVALAEDFRNDVLVARGTAPAGGRLPPTRPACGSTVRTSSSRASAASPTTIAVAGTEVRLAAMSDTGSAVRVTGAFTEATTVDLLGRPLSAAPVADGLELALGPWEIRTVVVR